MARFALLLTACLAWSLTTSADAKGRSKPTKTPTQELKSLASNYGVELENLSVYATTDEPQNSIILDINSKKTLTPASVTKVITASAVLDNFPPQYRFKTQILGVVDPKTAAVKGDVYLKGGGDPSFIQESLEDLVQSFAKNKIKRIEGDIVVDDSLFDNSRYDSSREQARVDLAYDAPVGAMSFAHNTVSLWVSPTKSGKTVTVSMDPENDYIRLITKAKTVRGRRSHLMAERRHSKTFGDLILISGSLGEKYNPILVEKNVTQPDIWAGSNLKYLFAKKGITVTGTIRNGLTPPNAKVLAEHESKPIEEILLDMNKSSNNFVAEMLAKNLGTLVRPTGATLADGVRIINKHLKKLGLDDNQFKISNPSGLTRDNKISSNAIWKILEHLRQDPRAQEAFINSLPIAGVDGTLKTRKIASAEGTWVKAKTGYIRNVTALAGYAKKKNGQIITFSFVYNGDVEEQKVQAFFDKLIYALL